MTDYTVRFNETQRRLILLALENLAEEANSAPEIIEDSVEINPGDGWGMLAGPDKPEDLLEEVTILVDILTNMPEVHKEDPDQTHALNA